MNYRGKLDTYNADYIIIARKGNPSPQNPLNPLNPHAAGVSKAHSS